MTNDPAAIRNDMLQRAYTVPWSAIPLRFLLCLAFILCFLPAAAISQTYEPTFDELELYGRLEKYERKCYEGLRYLMNDYQKKQYLTLPTWKERDEWLRRFWRLLDPTPATKKNERRIEHEERVKAARERYPKDGFPGWDNRGETLIRFGEPDWITEVAPKLTEAESRTEDFDIKMPGEVWHYGRLKMVVPFEEVNLDGECIYYMELKTVSRSMQEEYAQIGPGGANIYNSEWWSFLNEWMTYSAGNVAELYFAATNELLTFYSHLENNRSFHKAELERVPLECYFDFTSFKGGHEKIRTEVNFEIPLRELTFQQKLDKQHSRFQVKITAFDLEMNEIAYATDIVNLNLPYTFPLDRPSLIPAQFILTMDPGYYRFGLEVRDLKSKKHGCFRTSRYIDPLGDTLCISDIQFASSIGPAENKKTFVKGTLRVVPHPLHAYRKPNPVKIYFEIYGLDTNDEDFGFYSVEYSIEPKQKKRWGPVLKDAGTVITSKFETAAYGSTQRERLEIDTGELWEGSYHLKVTVMDRRTYESVEKITSFSILE